MFLFFYQLSDGIIFLVALPGRLCPDIFGLVQQRPVFWIRVVGVVVLANSCFLTMKFEPILWGIRIWVFMGILTGILVGTLTGVLVGVRVGVLVGVLVGARVGIITGIAWGVS